MDRKKSLLSAQNLEKTLRFTTEHVSLPPVYWNDVIFSDGTKIMLYYHDGPQRFWHKPLTALENKNLRKTFCNAKGLYIQQGSWCNRGFGWNNDQGSISWYFNNELIASIKKFGFIDPINPNKFYYKYYQDNDPKHKSYLCRSWSLYNCIRVIETLAHLKKKVGKRSPTNKNELIRFIKGEGEKIPSEYNSPKFIQSMRRRLQAVIDAQGGHTKY